MAAPATSPVVLGVVAVERCCVGWILGGNGNFLLMSGVKDSSSLHMFCFFLLKISQSIRLLMTIVTVMIMIIKCSPSSH